MPSFRCIACGAYYEDPRERTTCPDCGGLGLPDKGCTCTYFKTFAGESLKTIDKKDPRCPVHNAAQAKTIR